MAAPQITASPENKYLLPLNYPLSMYYYLGFAGFRRVSLRAADDRGKTLFSGVDFEYFEGTYPGRPGWLAGPGWLGPGRATPARLARLAFFFFAFLFDGNH